PLSAQCCVATVSPSFCFVTRRFTTPIYSLSLHAALPISGSSPPTSTGPVTTGSTCATTSSSTGRKRLDRNTPRRECRGDRSFPCHSRPLGGTVRGLPQGTDRPGPLLRHARPRHRGTTAFLHPSPRKDGRGRRWGARLLRRRTTFGRCPLRVRGRRRPRDASARPGGRHTRRPGKRSGTAFA